MLQNSRWEEGELYISLQIEITKTKRVIFETSKIYTLLLEAIFAKYLPVDKMQLLRKSVDAYSWGVIIATVPIGFSNGFNHKGDMNMKAFSLILAKTLAQSAIFPYTAYRWIKSKSD
uniref:Membrane protein n=1 Tax=Marseillevirus sp. TaxID=2809551 RepID=A0AA96ELW9_9VIRU|nr:membrane protein [Marseillevirus sp.]